MAEIDIIPVTIAAGQSLSAQVDIGTKSLVGIQIPSTWLAAPISLQASIDGGTTWGVVLTVAGGSTTPFQTASIANGTQVYVAIDPAILRGISSYKIQSGVPGTLVVQTGGVTLQLITRLAI